MKQYRRGPPPIQWSLKEVLMRCKVQGECWLWQLSFQSGAPRINGPAGPSVRRLVLRLTQPADVLAQLHRRQLSSSCGHPGCVAPGHIVRHLHEARRVGPLVQRGNDGKPCVTWHTNWVPPSHDLPVNSIFNWGGGVAR